MVEVGSTCTLDLFACCDHSSCVSAHICSAQALGHSRCVIYARLLRVGPCKGTVVGKRLGDSVAPSSNFTRTEHTHQLSTGTHVRLHTLIAWRIVVHRTSIELRHDCKSSRLFRECGRQPFRRLRAVLYPLIHIMANTIGQRQAAQASASTGCRMVPALRTPVQRRIVKAHSGLQPMEKAMFGDNFGARDPYAAELESNFGEKVLGNWNTDHIIK